jgi:hypothetical protein
MPPKRVAYAKVRSSPKEPQQSPLRESGQQQQLGLSPRVSDGTENVGAVRVEVSSPASTSGSDSSRDRGREAEDGSICTELGYIWRVAWPTAISTLLRAGTQQITVMIVGRIGSAELGAVGECGGGGDYGRRDTYQHHYYHRDVDAQRIYQPERRRPRAVWVRACVQPWGPCG